LGERGRQEKEGSRKKWNKENREKKWDLLCSRGQLR